MKINHRNNAWSRHSLLELSSPTTNLYKTERRFSLLNYASKKMNFFYLTQEKDEMIFNPENKMILIWDTLNVSIILVDAILIPIILSFPEYAVQDFIVIELSASLFFLLDIFVKGNTGIYDQGHLMSDRMRIFRQYMRRDLVIDVYSVIPFTYFQSLFAFFPYFLPIKLLKVHKVYHYFATIQLVLKDILLMKVLYYFKIFITVVLTLHWLACLWTYIGMMSINEQYGTWIINEGTWDLPVVFIKSIYYVVTTTSTLGYGDYTPYGIKETLASLIILFIGVILFSFNLTSILNLVSESRQSLIKYQEKMITLNVYMKSKKLPKFLKFKLRKYLEYTHKSTKSKLKEENILKILSEPLREELFGYTAGGKLIRKCKIFLQLYEGKVIRKLSLYFKNRVFSSSDVILEEGETSFSIFFIISGTVEVFHSGTRTVFKILKPGNFFGEIGFFAKKPRTATIRCADMVECLTFRREELDLILNKFPLAAGKTKDIETSCMYNDFHILGITCYLCNKLGHVASECKDSRLSPFALNIPQNWIKNKNESRAVNPRTYRKHNINRHVKAQPVHSRRKDLEKSLGHDKIEYFSRQGSLEDSSSLTENNEQFEGIRRILTSEESVNFNTEPKPGRYHFSIIRNEEVEVSDLY